MKNTFYQLFVLLFILVGCGKSPFLDEVSSQADTSNSGRALFAQVDLDLGARDGQGQGGNTSVALEVTGLWQNGPSVSGKNKMLVLVKDASGNRLDIKHDVHAFLWMPDMGHGSVPIKIAKIDHGIYELSNIVFIMDGLWDIHFQFKNGDVVAQEVVWPLSL